MSALIISVVKAWREPRDKNLVAPERAKEAKISQRKLERGRIRREVQAVQEQQELNEVIKEVWE